MELNRPIKARSLKLEILETYGLKPSGGAFKILGMECIHIAKSDLFKH